MTENPRDFLPFPRFDQVSTVSQGALVWTHRSRGVHAFGGIGVHATEGVFAAVAQDADEASLLAAETTAPGVWCGGAVACPESPAW